MAQFTEYAEMPVGRGTVTKLAHYKAKQEPGSKSYQDSHQVGESGFFPYPPEQVEKYQGGMK